MRLFVAIAFPETLVGLIRLRAEAAKRAIPDPKSILRWAGPEKLHLTLKFLGKTHEGILPAVKDTLREAATKHRSFKLELGGIGGFGGSKGYRTLWLGIEEGAQETKRLAESLDLGFEALGFAREPRGFHPHVTLARCKTGACRVEMKTLNPQLVKLPVGEFRPSDIALYRSTLLPSGSEYQILERFPLGV